MKVLWFSNTPALAQEYLNQQMKGSGGWMAALDRNIQDKVALSVAFTYPYNISPFKYGQTMYYPVYTGSIFLENLKQRWLNKVYDEDFLEQYLKIIETVKPDIIHIHGTENSFSCIIDKVSVPIVVSIQGVLTVISHKFRSGMFGDQMNLKLVTIKLKDLLFGNTSFKHHQKKLAKMSIIEQRNLSLTKFVIGRTEWDRRVTRVLAPKSTYFIVNEALRNSFYLETWYKESLSGKLIIHTTNSNSYFKGFETLCSALTLLVERGVDVEWRVAGVSDSSLIVKVVKKKLKDNYPAKGLVLLGSLNEQELVERLKEAHIYVMTSHIENSPNNLCEAMMLGMPCIATFVGGTNSMLESGQDGLLIQDGDPWSMAGAILELTSSWKTAIEYGINAREKALKRHKKEEIVNSLIAVYNRIVNENSNSN